MSVRSGFWNSADGDIRTYYNDDFSNLISLLIKDGVHQNFGDKFKTVPGQGMQVIVKSGKAWFNNTWIYNEGDLVISISPAPTVPGSTRMDIIALKIDASDDVRNASIEYIKGNASTGSVAPPELVDTDTIHWHILSIIRVNTSITSIEVDNIFDHVGTSDVPYITGLVDTISTEELISKWDIEWEAWENEKKAEFAEWINELHYILDGDVAGHLQTEIENRLLKDGSNANRLVTLGDNLKLKNDPDFIGGILKPFIDLSKANVGVLPGFSRLIAAYQTTHIDPTSTGGVGDWKKPGIGMWGHGLYGSTIPITITYPTSNTSQKTVNSTIGALLTACSKQDGSMYISVTRTILKFFACKHTGDSRLLLSPELCITLGYNQDTTFYTFCNTILKYRMNLTDLYYNPDSPPAISINFGAIPRGTKLTLPITDPTYYRHGNSGVQGAMVSTVVMDSNHLEKKIALNSKEKPIPSRYSDMPPVLRIENEFLNAFYTLKNIPRFDVTYGSGKPVFRSEFFEISLEPNSEFEYLNDADTQVGPYRWYNDSTNDFVNVDLDDMRCFPYNLEITIIKDIPANKIGLDKIGGALTDVPIITEEGVFNNELGFIFKLGYDNSLDDSRIPIYDDHNYTIYTTDDFILHEVLPDSRTSEPLTYGIEFGKTFTKNGIASGDGLIHRNKDCPQATFGTYNKPRDFSPLVIGNGTGEDNRSNAAEIDMHGNMFLANALQLNGAVYLQQGVCEGKLLNAADAPVIDLEDGATYLLMCYSRTKSNQAYRGIDGWILCAPWDPNGIGITTTAQARAMGPKPFANGTVGANLNVNLTTSYIAKKPDGTEVTAYHARIGIGSCTTDCWFRWTLTKIMGTAEDF